MAQPWFHGQLSRAAAEARLRAEGQKYAPGTIVFLVRKSSSRPKDFVISTLESGTDLMANMIVLVTPAATGSVLYKIDSETKEMPSFANMQSLLDHYKIPGSGLQCGPLTVPVAAPAAPEPPQPETSASAVGGAESADAGQLRCEGYLEKKRGVGKNRTRYFQLTSKRLSYFSEDAGELIYSCDLDDVIAVSDIGKKQMRVITKRPFGSGPSAAAETVLEAPNSRIKTKWLQAFQDRENLSGGMRSQPGNLLREGYLSKVQSGLDSSKTRFFVLTDQAFGYYQEEGGELMGVTRTSDITNISAPGAREFKVTSNQRFTVTGAFEVLCRADSVGARNKWLGQLKLALPDTVFQN